MHDERSTRDVVRARRARRQQLLCDCGRPASRHAHRRDRLRCAPPFVLWTFRLSHLEPFALSPNCGKARWAPFWKWSRRESDLQRRGCRAGCFLGNAILAAFSGSTASGWQLTNPQSFSAAGPLTVDVLLRSERVRSSAPLSSSPVRVRNNGELTRERSVCRTRTSTSLTSLTEPWTSASPEASRCPPLLPFPSSVPAHCGASCCPS